MKKETINIPKILYEICEDKRVFEEGIDLIESGLLDSYAFIELFTILEDYGIEIQPTRINRDKLRNIEGINQLINEYKENK